MLRVYHTLVATVIAATLAGCAGDGGSVTGSSNQPPPVNVTGTYQLLTVDGKALPAPLGSPVVDSSFTITAYAHTGKIVFNADSTYQLAAAGEIVATGIVMKKPFSIQRSGTYTYDATTVRLVSSTGTSTMSRSGTSLTSVVSVPALDGGTETVTMVFKR